MRKKTESLSALLITLVAIIAVGIITTTQKPPQTQNEEIPIERIVTSLQETPELSVEPIEEEAVIINLVDDDDIFVPARDTGLVNETDTSTGGETAEEEVPPERTEDDIKVILLEETSEDFEEVEVIPEVEEEPEIEEVYEEPAPVEEEEEEPVYTSYYSPFSEDERIVLAKTLYGEANSVESTAERAMVVWCILNRYDSPYFSGDIIDIVTAPMQFTGYSYGHPVTDRNLALVDDVIERYVREKNGETGVGRVLPSDILFFHADSSYGWHNAFYKYEYGLSGDTIYFDRDCPPENPY